jgi:hypothetical protein
VVEANGPWSVLRGLRATPPGHAAPDNARGRVFAAALEQAEQFLTAAASVGYATKPVQLFYALSQAGRAIAAAHAGEAWQIHGHGARVDESSNIGQTTVEPDARSSGAMSVVAGATGSELWSGQVELAALWASLPELPADPGIVGSSAEPMAVELEYVDYSQPAYSPGINLTAWSVYPAYTGHTCRLAFRVKDRPSDVEEQEVLIGRLLAPYPKAAGWSIGSGFVASNVYDPEPSPIVVEWVRENDGERVMTPPQQLTELYDGKMYFRPGIGPSLAVPSPLITWWGILLALSSLARYEPVVWRRALDIDRSPIAWALERGLAIAEQRIPELVLNAVTG